VLPFANRSEDKSNAYFAEGIQDEILSRLAKISALKVISRTSTAHYASAPTDLPAIAKQLGVANIVEGSVQKVGDQVRISVQLIEAGSDTHLWAETYDRKLIDIFGVESEVAKAIADSLQARLTGSEQQELALRPTDNVEAYDAYLRGRGFEARSSYDIDALDTATRFFAQATQLDPQFAQAWARLSKVNALAVFGLTYSGPARREASKQALDKAVELQPNATDTLLAQAYYQFWILRDFAEAKRMFEALWPRLPGSSDIPFALTAIARRQGLWDQSLAYSDQAIALDPRDPVLLSERAFTYSVSRRYAEAIKTLDRRLEIVPGDPNTIAFQVSMYQTQGQLDQARQLLGRLPSDAATVTVMSAKTTQSLLEHDYPRLVEVLTAELARPESATGSIAAENRARLGAENRARLGFAQTLVGDVVASKTTNILARREFEGLREEEPDNPRIAGRLALVYAALGEKDLALKEGERAVALLPASRDALVGPASEETLAAVEAQVGEPGRAIARLQHLLSIGYAGRRTPGPITVALLRLDPIWDPLRGDPRFQKLIAEGEAPKPIQTPDS
jgi:TolB-like protein